MKRGHKMLKFNMDNTPDKFYLRQWKETNEEYLYELQKFLDIADNITDERLKLDVIYQMLKCDEVLTKMIEENFIDRNKKSKKDNTTNKK